MGARISSRQSPHDGRQAHVKGYGDPFLMEFSALASGELSYNYVSALSYAEQQEDGPITWSGFLQLLSVTPILVAQD
ncbi:hypothetical protein PGTUg99_037471 [Puccinia graminis f. sp. tritici]|uniref:Uncharacterized protein n=1 Tax=Puccinia graminis f. sp. tritici TaxID=56615 RepID=A0A5B0SR94_PUCGR|nr:hypothetical protein PGTUg99_037471 [Puccinia graminis f. sp. tritici]